MSLKPLIFLGGSYQIVEIREVCDLLGIPISGIIDADYYGNTNQFDGIPYIDGEDTANWVKLKDQFNFFIGINPVPNYPRNVVKRKKMLEIVNQFDLPCINIIDPQCRISPRAQLGQGIFVAYNAYIGPNAVIGDHCQIHCLASVAHDVKMSQNTTLQRGAVITGNVTVGLNSYIGMSTRILKPDSTLGDDCVISSGMIVFRDVGVGEKVTITSKKIYSMIADFEQEN